ncbi:murein biosynthesis integral membrane protein MurJ [Pararhodospirillum oryzae]|uniref:Probable lipid II flippase MurJ n=1 Tax=Pararhodospirillum oryzae TaxID=478448 RepID=A0A512HC82_9PROT|nr:murein biosynthesis integral membrane protein MurJ [Pararhodospirillum oryzae]GEO83053.1 putative lipid II flippase MurJ [Pararhodospirillum oryzae]
MSLLRAITTVGGYTLLSRVAGFVRDILIARALGAGAVADAFFVAFRFPNLFRSLFAEGAFSAAFVPLFAGQLESEGREAAWRFAREAYTVLALLLLGFVALMEIVMPWAMIALAPGFVGVPGKLDLAVELSRIAFPYLLFISLSSLQSGVLNSLGHFAAPAAAPILLNLTLITALLGFDTLAPTPGHALAWAVSAAGVLQFLWLAVHCHRAGLTVTLTRPRLSPLVRRLGRRVVPVVFGSSLYQVNLLIGTILASMVSDGAVSYLYYADRVTQLPLGVIGIAVGTALLPLLSRQLKAGDLPAARWSQNRALEIALLLTVPAAAALITLATPITTTLFERGAFTPEDTRATAAAMIAFGAGLPAFVLVKVLTPAFYAREDTATPVRIAAVAMVVNVVLNLALMGPLGHIGIALGTTVSSWLNAVALAVVLHRRALFSPDGRLLGRLPRLLGATALMAGALVGALFLLDPLLDHGDLARIPALAGLIALGLVVYGGAAWLLGATSVADLKGALRRPRAPTPPEAGTP